MNIRSGIGAVNRTDIRMNIRMNIRSGIGADMCPPPSAMHTMLQSDLAALGRGMAR